MPMQKTSYTHTRIEIHCIQIKIECQAVAKKLCSQWASEKSSLTKVSVSSSIKWDTPSFLLCFWGVNEWIYIKPLERCLAHSKRTQVSVKPPPCKPKSERSTGIRWGRQKWGEAECATQREQHMQRSGGRKAHCCTEGILEGSGDRREGAKGVSVDQSRQFLCGGWAANGAFQAGEFHDWTGFPRKSSLATVRKTSWREAQTGWQRGHLTIVAAKWGGCEPKWCQWGSRRGRIRETQRRPNPAGLWTWPGKGWRRCNQG